MIKQISVKYRVDPNPRKTKERQILAYIRGGNQTVVRKTNIKVLPTQFNENNNGSVRASHRDSVELNDRLKSFKNKIENNIAIVTKKDPDATLKEIVDYKPPAESARKVKNEDIFTIFDKYIDVKKKKHKIGKIKLDTVQKYHRVKNHLLDYSTYVGETFEIQYIDEQFLENYFIYLIDEKNMLNNTAHKQISMLKGFLLWCALNGYKINTRYKLFKEEVKENEVIFLTDQEIEKLENVKLPHPHLERSRDLFLFQLYIGKRWSEIEIISTADIIGSTWTVRIPKTEKIEKVMLPDKALSIVDKYKSVKKDFYNKFGEFAPLPIISNQKQNQYIKEVCKIAGIDTPTKIYKYKGSTLNELVKPKWQFIGTHTARRSFITKAILQGEQTELVMSLSGHRDYKSFKKYLNVTTEAKEQAVNRIWK